jgi:phospholipase/carboxylesterase
MILLAIDSSTRTWDLITSGAVGPDARLLDLALQHTFDRLRVDPTRLVLGGFSDGATYAVSLGPVNGDLFSHIVAYSPGIRVALGPLTGRPRIYISHGTGDPVLPVSNTRDSTVPRLRDSGYDVTFVEFGGGHSIPDPIIDSSLNWFLN